MDIVDIDGAIEELEAEDATVETVQELANLYIVREHMKVCQLHVTEKSITSVLDTTYQNYCNSKALYQQHLVSDELVVENLKKVCQELSDLMSKIYSNSDMRKERNLVLTMVSNLFEKFSKK